MRLSTLYEELLTGKSITLQASPQDIASITAQFRVIKGRYEAKFAAVSGESLSEGKVIRVVTSSDNTHTVSLAISKRTSKLNFKILESTEGSSEGS
jgi:hypothetical protein